jgi:cell division protease FtsH
MNNDNKMKPESKKKLPGGFFIFFLAALLAVLIFQNFSADKGGKVSFSYQVEHLVNLDLLDKEYNKKISLNDNLVTFSGKFKDSLQEDSVARYRYLELLNKNHDFQEEQKRLTKELNLLEKNVKDSADLFLHLSAIPIPKGGYRVVDPYYDSLERPNAIVIKELSPKEISSIKDIEVEFKALTSASSAEKLDQLGRDLSLLIQHFRSPALGIGSESIKNQLQALHQEVDATFSQASTLTVKEKLNLYQSAITELQTIIVELNSVKDYARLLQLRSVRNYLEDVSQYALNFDGMQKNEAQLDKARQNVADVIWYFNNKELSTRSLEEQPFPQYAQWFAQAKAEWDNYSYNKGSLFKAPDQPRNLVLDNTFKSQEPSPNYFSYILTMMPVVLIVLLLYFVFSRQMKGMGSSAMNFGKSPAKLLNKSSNKITFADVAGIDEAKEELEEVVDFLKDPTKFTALGARIPKGVLCIGPPGTGKTLIAKAVAGEADRPFFSISGSDFVEMFVGVGASRIRDLFDQAKKQAPCIVFIDEIDAVGRHRGAGIGGGHDEREQTLNQLLVEMDGFDTNEGVILVAATNRPDVLDKALLRPGRFDRRIVLNLPDIKGRLEILKVHAKKIKLDPTVDLTVIARATPGCSGADLMNVLNESALLAARKGRSAVTAEDTMEACDKVKYGKERRSLELDQNEKLNTAYHESGHAVVGLCVRHSDPIEKVTIIPRGISLGATYFSPEKNKVSYWKKELLDRLAVLMGGRVAEEIFLDDVSSGAQMDIFQATSLARSMVCEWGMTESLGKVAYDRREGESGYYSQASSDKNYSDETAKEIDEAVRELLDEAYETATKIVAENREKVELMTRMLLEFETLDQEDVKDIMKGEWSLEKKKAKIEAAAKAHRKLPPTPPELKAKPVIPSIQITPQQSSS